MSGGREWVRERLLDAVARRWWDNNTGDTELWDELTEDERATVIDSENLAPLADAALSVFDVMDMEAELEAQEADR